MAKDKLPIVDLVIADRGWIMEEMAREIAKGAPALNCRILDAPSHNADLTYFLPYSIQTEVDRGATVSFFTHQENVEPAHTRFVENAKIADHCICMSRRYERVLRDAGVGHVTTIFPGVDHSLFYPKLRVGVVGRTYHTGRKGEELLAQLVHEPWLDFIFLGRGWPGRSRSLQTEEMGDFYRSLDCLLVPSNIEGGPMPVIEAIASGCQVVAPDVGFVEMFPHLSYQMDDVGSLSRVLEQLHLEKTKLSMSAEDLTWEAYAREHEELFLELVCSSADDHECDSIVLVQHGSESHAKGGPTTRMSLLADQMHERGLEAEVRSLTELETGTQLDPSAVIHVFNSWPLHTAIDALERSQKLGGKVAFSPIALDLRYLPIYQERLPQLLKDGGLNPASLESLKQETPEVDPGDLREDVFEGVGGHLRAIRNGCAIADIVVALSDFEVRFLTRIGVNPKKIRLVRNGIDVEVMRSASPDRFVEEYGVRDFILCVGRIEARKNQAVLAYAVREFDATVVFIGHQGDRDYFNAIKGVAGRNALFIDRIDDRSLLASAYHAAALTVLVSWCEGAPLVALEAGAAGCPLLLSSMSGEREYFREYADYVHPLDVEGMRHYVSEALCNKESAAQRKQRSKFICSEYSIERHCDRTLSVYNEPLEEACNGATYIDITHLAHAKASANDTTGMPKLEKEMFREFVKNSNLQFLVWNSYFSTHVLVPREKVESFQDYATGKQPAEASLDLFSSWRRAVNDQTLTNPMTRKRLLLSLLKAGISKLPGRLAGIVIGGVRRFRPLFNADLEREHEITWERFKASLLGRGHHRQQTKTSVQEPYKLERQAIPAVLDPASRVILCGQPWISNDRYISSLQILLDGRSSCLTLLIPDVIYATHVESFPRHIRSGFVQRLHRMLQMADTVLAPSRMTEASLRDIRSTYAYDYKVEKVRLGVPMLAERELSVSGLGASQFVLYVASLNNRKNHEFLVEAWNLACANASFRNKKLKLVLAGSDQLEGDLAEIINESVRSGQVVLTGAVSDEQLSWLYHNCLFTVYPSKVEGWGFPVHESLVAGKVCVASNKVPAATDYAGSGIITLDPNDMFGWMELISTLALNDVLRRSLESKIDSGSPALWSAMVQNLVEKDA